MASAQRQSWLALQARNPTHGAVARMAEMGRLLPGGEALGTADAVEHLTITLEAWTEELALPRLSAYGVGPADLERLATASARGLGGSLPRSVWVGGGALAGFLPRLMRLLFLPIPMTLSLVAAAGLTLLWADLAVAAPASRTTSPPTRATRRADAAIAVSRGWPSPPMAVRPTPCCRAR